MLKKIISALLVLTMTLGIVSVSHPSSEVTVSAREWPGRPGGNWGNGDSLTIGGLKYGDKYKDSKYVRVVYYISGRRLLTKIFGHNSSGTIVYENEIESAY